MDRDSDAVFLLCSEAIAAALRPASSAVNALKLQLACCCTILEGIDLKDSIVRWKDNRQDVCGDEDDD
jgi:hypothetical protein